MIRKSGLLTSIVGVVATLLLSVSPAAAAPSDMELLWWGEQHIEVDNSTGFGGWVDGNGPDSYQAWVACTGGGDLGVVRWAGDRRGSYAYCPAGTVTSKGFYLIAG